MPYGTAKRKETDPGGSRRKRRVKRHTPSTDLPRASEVTITRADGTVEIQPAYGKNKKGAIVSEGQAKKKRKGAD